MRVNNRLLRWLLIIIGLISTGLGIIGIFVPLLPTTPFLLLAAACFARSSDRFHTWLIEHNHLGPLVRGYLDGSGIPLRAKQTAITLVWLTLGSSTLLLVKAIWLQVVLILLAPAITWYLWHLPVRKETQ
ncbi:MAG: YbaN family protein [Geobacteraceae bacterium]|nr:YbaN family protein [Geobacteraceae bacterium]